MKIGFIGTGTMGRPMLANLVKKGFAVSAYDIVPAALDAAVEFGAARAGSPAAAAADSDLLITMLPSSANVEAAYRGAGGIIEGDRDADLLDVVRAAAAALEVILEACALLGRQRILEIVGDELDELLAAQRCGAHWFVPASRYSSSACRTFARALCKRTL